MIKIVYIYEKIPFSINAKKNSSGTLTNLIRLIKVSGFNVQSGLMEENSIFPVAQY